MPGLHDGGSAILQWTGTTWTVAKSFPSTGELTGATAIDPTHVWIFGGGGFVGGFGTWFWNGSTLTQWHGNASGLERASAVSASNIWAIGGLSSPDTAIEHFNGSRWSFVTPKSLHGRQFGGILAEASNNVWLTSSGQGGSNQTVLAHDNGTSWSIIKLPWQIDLGSALTRDGTGGIWLTGTSGKTAYALHRPKAGTWSRFAFPAGTSLADLALIPHSDSVLAAGGETTKSGAAPAVWQYGSAG